MTPRTLSAFFLAAIAVIPATARAGCHTGETPRWSDVSTIRITRCVTVAEHEPCYYARLQNGRGDSVNAGLVAHRLGALLGWFNANASNGWSAAVSQLKRADFFNLNLTVPPVGPNGVRTIAVLDGPRDEISVTRCARTVTLRHSGYDDLQSPGYKAFSSLLVNLQSTVQSMPWKRNIRDPGTAHMSDVLSAVRL